MLVKWYIYNGPKSVTLCKISWQQAANGWEASKAFSKPSRLMVRLRRLPGFNFSWFGALPVFTCIRVPNYCLGLYIKQWILVQRITHVEVVAFLISSASLITNNSENPSIFFKVSFIFLKFLKYDFINFGIK